MSRMFYKRQRSIIGSSFRKLLLRLTSGGLPHKSVARVLIHKGEEGIVLGIF